MSEPRAPAPTAHASRAAVGHARARREPVRRGTAVHVLPRVDGRRGDLDRTARAVDEPAHAAVRGSRRRCAIRTTSTARCRCRSSSGRAASAASRSTSPAPRARTLVRRLRRARRCVRRELAARARWREFGLGYDELARSGPRLVYCAISGYGQADEERPAMDMIVQAASGVMAKTGFADGPPLRSGITIADHTTATFAALGIVAALRQRDLTGQGQLVDVAMLDVLTALVWDEPVDHYAASGVPVRTGNADARGAPINAYRCADGWVAVTCTSDGQFERLCALMEQPELRTRFPDVRARAAGARELDAAIEAWTVTRPARDVEQRARRYRVPGRPRARSGRGRGRPGRTESRAPRGAAPPRRAARSPERLPRCAPADRVRRAGSTCRPRSDSARAPTPCCTNSPAATTRSSTGCATPE